MKVEHTLDRLAKLKEQNEIKKVKAAKLERAKDDLKRKAKLGAHRGAKVQISPKAKELDMIKKIVRADNTDNAEKIARLKKLIAEKKYDVPAEKFNKYFLHAFCSCINL